MGGGLPASWEGGVAYGWKTSDRSERTSVLGKRSAQRGLFEADTQYREFVGQRTFYGYLASQRDELFRDEDFAVLYSRHRGRPSVPPSLLATALVLQTYDGVSDEEAKQRADYDLRWKVALGLEVETRPFAKSTLQEFRAQLILQDKTRAIFQRSLEVAKHRGVWKKGKAPEERQHIKLAPALRPSDRAATGRQPEQPGQPATVVEPARTSWSNTDE